MAKKCSPRVFKYIFSYKYLIHYGKYFTFYLGCVKSTKLHLHMKVLFSALNILHTNAVAEYLGLNV